MCAFDAEIHPRPGRRQVYRLKTNDSYDIIRTHPSFHANGIPLGPIVQKEFAKFGLIFDEFRNYNYGMPDNETETDVVTMFRMKTE